jgi:hypothetical protein
MRGRRDVGEGETEERGKGGREFFYPTIARIFYNYNLHVVYMYIAQLILLPFFEF